MQQYLNMWTGLGLRRQVIVILATVAMFIGVLSLSRMATAPSMTLLYAGLESGAAGDVVAALEQRNVAFDVRGGSIFVDSQQRDQLRLTLASEGLPANGSRGYELLDQLTGFGTTSQMFDAAYWRAKEGELARTIVANPKVTMARVHIASTGSNPFQRGVEPKASVSVTPSGGAVTPAQAKAIRYLVASAVAGLEPENVAVIDANGAVVGTGDETTPTANGEDKSNILRERVQRLLEAHVGFGNAVVEVSVDTVTESEAIRERRFDPDSRVAISTDTEERSNTSQDVAGGEVTVASNLPDQQGANGDGASSQNSETRERVNYEVSETEREVIRAPGAIKRLSVAVLVNQDTTKSAEGAEQAIPRTEEDLAALRDLVASAVGFNEARGDVITIKSMSMQSASLLGTPAPSSLVDRLNLNVMSMIQMLIMALVILILGMFVVRPILAKSRQEQQPARAALPLDSTLSDTSEVLTGEVEQASDMLEPTSAMTLPSEMGVNTLTTPALEGNTTDPVERLRTLIGERQEETVEILRGWLEDKEENV